jgi:hypothetical protein
MAAFALTGRLESTYSCRSPLPLPRQSLQQMIITGLEAIFASSNELKGVVSATKAT